ncbi:MAG TPA: YbdK family carboxylate-amine ligase [Thermoleophilaceae bacterium]|nr:YbdK family carboxylate-amine ligase [Thermoleophilaceae bacterium]
MAVRERERPPASWATWNAGARYTLGVEDEVMLLDPTSWSLAQDADRVLAALPADLGSRTHPETHAGVVELVTGAHHRLGPLVAEIRELRARLALRLERLGLAAAGAGTHPAVDVDQTDVSSAPRYRLLQDTMRSLARRDPTLALHVHIGVPDPQDAVTLLNEVRQVAPVLIALSANSPYSRGRDSGFASVRRALFQAFPRTGTPRHFEGYGDYVRAVESLVAPGAVPDPSFLWWDIRLQPRFGTVELRMMDSQSRLDDIAALVAFVQSFARLVIEESYVGPGGGPEVVSENAFLAARDGIDARLIDPRTERLVPVRDLLGGLLARCLPHAAALGCATELDGVRRLAAENGASRQRALHVGEGGFEDLLASLAQEFAPTGVPVAAST